MAARGHAGCGRRRRWLLRLLVVAVLVVLQAKAVIAEDRTDGAPSKDADPPAETSLDSSPNDVLGNFTLSVSVEIGEQGTAGVPPREVYSRGVAVGKWATCRSDFYNDDDCFSDTAYTTQISFEFEFESSVTPDVKEPAVMTAGGKATAVVEKFTFDQQQNNGDFVVAYNCSKASESDTVLTLEFEIAADTKAKFSWGKACASGVNDKMHLGYLENDVPSSVPTQFLPDGSLNPPDSWVVSPMEASSTLVLNLDPPGRYQKFEAPRFQTNADIVKVTMRGAQQGGVVYRGAFEIHAMYECKASTGISNVSLTIPIPPWEPLRAHWRKDCGGGLPLGLAIGTQAGSENVAEQGVVARDFAVDPDRIEQDANLYSLPLDKNTIRFYFTNQKRPGADAIKFDRISITSDQGLFAVKIAGSSWDSSAIQSSGGELHLGESKHLDIHIICKRSGESSILITLPTLRYQNVEFGFRKQCRKPKRIEETSVYTARNVAHLIVLFGLVAVGAGIFMYRRRQREVKHELIVPDAH